MSKYTISNSGRKYKFTPLTQRTPVLLLLILALGFLSKAAWNAYLENKRSKEVTTAAKEELTKLEERQIFVSEELNKLSSPKGREAKLREKFGVSYPGEQVAIIVEGANNNGVDFGSDFWTRIKNFFSVLFQK